MAAAAATATAAELFTDEARWKGGDEEPVCALLALRSPDPDDEGPPPFAYSCVPEKLYETWPSHCYLLESSTVAENFPADCAMYEGHPTVLVCYPPVPGSEALKVLEEWYAQLV